MGFNQRTSATTRESLGIGEDSVTFHEPERPLTPSLFPSGGEISPKRNFAL